MYFVLNDITINTRIDKKQKIEKKSSGMTPFIIYVRCVARFGTICTI